MLELFFEDGGTENAKVKNSSFKMTDNSPIFQAAARVASRYKDNFAVKHLQLQQLWDACPEADMDNIIERSPLEELNNHTKKK